MNDLQPGPGRTRPAARDAASALVVGAGAFGCAAADALARRGWRVTILERYAPANARGSSGDRTRQLRCGHGTPNEEEDLWYVRSAAWGIQLWRALDQELGAGLIEATGLLWLAARGEDASNSQPGPEELARRRLAAAGMPHEVLSPGEVRGMFPSVAVDDLAFALHEPDAAVIRARDAVLALLGRARAHGAVLQRATARPAGAGRVELDDGARLDADAVVWACGAWLGALFERDAPVQPTRQNVIHWQTPPHWERTPSWFDEQSMTYGFPDLDGLGVKIVSHRPGPALDVERDERLPDADQVQGLGRYIAHRFPELAGARPLWGRVMAYEMTPDQNFILGPAGELERHWLLGGGSGHGFKHAPALGELLADAIEGRAELPAMLAPGPRRSRPEVWI